MSINIQFFGGFEIWEGGKPYDLTKFNNRGGQKIVLLLALLLHPDYRINNGEQARWSKEKLIELLWSNDSPTLFVPQFTTLLSLLRITTPLNAMIQRVHRGFVTINLKEIDVDIYRFLDNLESSSYGPAIEVYKDIYLQEFSGEVLPTILLDARKDYHRKYCDALKRLSSEAISTKDWNKVQEYSLKGKKADPEDDFWQPSISIAHRMDDASLQYPTMLPESVGSEIKDYLHRVEALGNWRPTSSPTSPSQDIGIPVRVSIKSAGPEGEVGHSGLEKANLSNIWEWDTSARSVYARCTILADSGAGKTWLLRREAARYAREARSSIETPDSEEDALICPIFANLHTIGEELISYVRSADEPISSRFAVAVINASMYVARPSADADSSCNELSDQMRKWLCNKVADGKCILLLDALDEVAPQARDLLLLEIERWTNANPHSRILLTSRRTGYTRQWTFESIVSTSGEVVLLPFEEADTHRYIHTFFLDEPKAGDQLCGLLIANARLQDLVRTPLLLYLMCRIFHNKRENPTFDPQMIAGWRRHDLLRESISLFMAAEPSPIGWRDQQRTLQSPIAPSTVQFENGLDILEQTALELIIANIRSQCRQRVFVESLKRGCQALDQPSPPTGILDDLLRAWTLDTGVLARFSTMTETWVEFPHSALQEYMAAGALARRLESASAEARQQAWKYVESGIWKPSWEPIIILLVGRLSMNGRRDLLERLLKVRDDEFKHCLALSASCLPEVFSHLDDQSASEVNTSLVGELIQLRDEITTRALRQFLEFVDSGITELIWPLRASLPHLMAAGGQYNDTPLTEWLVEKLEQNEKDAYEIVFRLGVTAANPVIINTLAHKATAENRLVSHYALTALALIGPAAATPTVKAILTQLITSPGYESASYTDYDESVRKHWTELYKHLLYSLPILSYPAPLVNELFGLTVSTGSRKNTGSYRKTGVGLLQQGTGYAEVVLIALAPRSVTSEAISVVERHAMEGTLLALWTYVAISHFIPDVDFNIFITNHIKPLAISGNSNILFALAHMDSERARPLIIETLVDTVAKYAYLEWHQFRDDRWKTVLLWALYEHFSLIVTDSRAFEKLSEAFDPNIPFAGLRGRVFHDVLTILASRQKISPILRERLSIAAKKPYADTEAFKELLLLADSPQVHQQKPNELLERALSAGYYDGWQDSKLFISHFIELGEAAVTAETTQILLSAISQSADQRRLRSACAIILQMPPAFFTPKVLSVLRGQDKNMREVSSAIKSALKNSSEFDVSMLMEYAYEGNLDAIEALGKMGTAAIRPDVATLCAERALEGCEVSLSTLIALGSEIAQFEQASNIILEAVLRGNEFAISFVMAHPDILACDPRTLSHLLYSYLSEDDLNEDDLNEDLHVASHDEPVRLISKLPEVTKYLVIACGTEIVEEKIFNMIVDNLFQGSKRAKSILQAMGKAAARPYLIDTLRVKVADHPEEWMQLCCGLGSAACTDTTIKNIFSRVFPAWILNNISRYSPPSMEWANATLTAEECEALVINLWDLYLVSPAGDEKKYQLTLTVLPVIFELSIPEDLVQQIYECEDVIYFRSLKSPTSKHHFAKFLFNKFAEGESNALTMLGSIGDAIEIPPIKEGLLEHPQLILALLNASSKPGRSDVTSPSTLSQIIRLAKESPAISNMILSVIRDGNDQLLQHIKHQEIATVPGIHQVFVECLINDAYSGNKHIIISIVENLDKSILEDARLKEKILSDVQNKQLNSLILFGSHTTMDAEYITTIFNIMAEVWEDILPEEAIEALARAGGAEAWKVSAVRNILIEYIEATNQSHVVWPTVAKTGVMAAGKYALIYRDAETIYLLRRALTLGKGCLSSVARDALAKLHGSAETPFLSTFPMFFFEFNQISNAYSLLNVIFPDKFPVYLLEWFVSLLSKSRTQGEFPMAQTAAQVIRSLGDIAAEEWLLDCLQIALEYPYSNTLKMKVFVALQGITAAYQRHKIVQILYDMFLEGESNADFSAVVPIFKNWQYNGIRFFLTEGSIYAEHFS